MRETFNPRWVKTPRKLGIIRINLRTCILFQIAVWVKVWAIYQNSRNQVIVTTRPWWNWQISFQEFPGDDFCWTFFWELFSDVPHYNFPWKKAFTSCNIKDGELGAKQQHLFDEYFWATTLKGGLHHEPAAFSVSHLQARTTSHQCGWSRTVVETAQAPLSLKCIGQKCFQHCSFFPSVSDGLIALLQHVNSPFDVTVKSSVFNSRVFGCSPKVSPFLRWQTFYCFQRYHEWVSSESSLNYAGTTLWAWICWQVFISSVKFPDNF